MSMVIAACYILLAAVYNVANPLFESPDERLHYEFVRTLQSEPRLPAVDLDGPPTEYHQPPAYYVTAALLTAPLRFPDIERYTQPNPFWGYQIGVVGSDNKNQYLHDPTLPLLYPPTVPIHALRFVSTLIGLASLLLTYFLARMFLSVNVSLAATVLMAFIPNFLLTSASITNDIFALIISAASCFYLIRLLHSEQAPPAKSWLGLGVLLSLAVLTKLNIWPLLVIAALTVTLLAIRFKSLSVFFSAGAILLTVVGLLSGWWLLRNLRLYGDLTGLAANAATWGTRGALGFQQTLIELLNMRTTFWANFGYGNVPVPSIYYFAGDIVLLGGVIGLMVAWGRYPSWVRNLPLRDSVLVMFAYVLMIFVGLILSMPNQLAVTGRHFYPVLPIITLMITVGWQHLFKQSVKPPIVLAYISFLTGTVALITVLIPSYQPTSARAASEPETSLNWQYGDVATLLGYTLADESIEAGTSVTVTLFWLPQREIDHNYTLFAHLYNMQGEQVGKRDTYPDAGKAPTIFWQPGEVVIDQVTIPTGETNAAPYLMPLEVGLYALDTGERLPINDPAGNAVGFPVVGSVKLEQTTPPSEGSTPPDAAPLFGDLAYLADSEVAQADEQITVTLDWIVKQPTAESLSVFVHLIDESGELVAQADGTPRNGYYPTTHWAAGEAFSDRYVLNTPADVQSGRYTVRVGFYAPETFIRLPVSSGGDFVTLAHAITISPE